MSLHIVTYSTPWGTGALAADDTGLTDVLWQPEKFTATKKPPTWLCRVAARLEQHLQGNYQSFQAAPIAWHLMTPFQRGVYQALLQVPAGQVVTYGDIAERIGIPGSYRAVANALASNRLPLIIPCHRVIRADGSLGGFTAPGGVRLKRWLLQSEGVVLH